ncbi:hypothetical protein VTI74DRAFT_6028 [Chaetomium olivicolor]
MNSWIQLSPSFEFQLPLFLSTAVSRTNIQRAGVSNQLGLSCIVRHHSLRSHAQIFPYRVPLNAQKRGRYSSPQLLGAERLLGVTSEQPTTTGPILQTSFVTNSPPTDGAAPRLSPCMALFLLKRHPHRSAATERGSSFKTTACSCMMWHPQAGRSSSPAPSL